MAEPIVRFEHISMQFPGVLANDDVISRANLKQTSLYTLAKHLGLEPEQVTRRFIAHEREARKA